MSNNPMEGGAIDLHYNQPLMSIRRADGSKAWIEAEDGKIKTSGFVGERTFDNFVQLIMELGGFDIHINDFFV